MASNKSWWHGKDARHVAIPIEDDSDCAACTARHASQGELLREVRCDLLTDLTCQECGRTIDVFVEAHDGE